MKKYFVYLHRNNYNNEVFYIGKETINGKRFYDKVIK